MPSITDAKKEYEAKLNRCFSKYSKVLFCGVDNVRSQQIHDIRTDLRGKGELVMGKKTLQAKIVSNRAAASGSSELDRTFARVCEESKLLTGNSGLLFTNADMKDITTVLDKYRVQAPARVGAVAPCDVIVPAGNTGMEPTMTSFFQALNIPTKITKGTVEIISDKKVLSTGDKVDNSTAALLQKLKISPFYYQLEILCVWDRGTIFTKADLSIDDAAIESMLMSGIANVNALSLGAGIPTASSIGILVSDAFKNLLAVSVATEYEFSEFNGAQLRKDAIAGKLGGGAAAPAPAAAAAAPAAAGKPAAAAAKAPEPEEEDDGDLMGGLF